MSDPRSEITLNRTIRDAAGLVKAGLIAPEAQAEIATLSDRYAIAITPAMQALIESPDDPIARQMVPDPAEAIILPHETTDPIGDERFSPVPGIVRRYPDRALLKPLLTCPVYCRFCFRRAVVGPDGGLLNPAQLQTALDWLRAETGVREVILTGGDPLMLSPRRLSEILQALDAIDHIEIIRIHTRMPVADPERVTEALAETFRTEKPLFLVVHANHAREFSPQAHAALARIQARGVPVLGQSVLLRGVNDDEAALEALFRAMLRARVKPYYLHQLDAAPGTARFHVPIARGRALLEALRGRVTGLAWPTYVLDVPGGFGKVPLGPDYWQPGVVGGQSRGKGGGQGGESVRDIYGASHSLAAPDPTR